MLAGGIILLPLLYNWVIRTRFYAELELIIYSVTFFCVILLVYFCFINKITNKIEVSLSLSDTVIGLWYVYMFFLAWSKDWRVDAMFIWGGISNLICYIVVKKMKFQWIVINSIIISGTLQSIIAFLQKFGYIRSNHSFFDVTGSFGNPGSLGCFLALALVASLCLFFYNKNSILKCVFYLLSSVLILFALVLADSRTSMLAVIVGLLIFFLHDIRKHCRKKSVLIVMLVIAFLGGIVILLYNYRVDSANARLLIWKVSLQMIYDKPICGHGLSSFNKEYMLYQASFFETRTDSHYSIIADNVAYPYNEFIHIGVEQGIIGMLFILLLVVLFFKAPVISNNRIFKSLLASFLIVSLFSYPANVFPLIILVPLICASIESARIIKMKCFSCLIQIILLVLMNISILQGLKFKDYSDEIKLSIREEDCMSNYLKMNLKDLKNELIFLNKMNMWLSKNQHYDLIIKYAHVLLPSCETYCEIGNAYASNLDFDKAEYYYKIASNMIPSRISPNYLLWRMYLIQGDNEKADFIALKILNQDVKICNTLVLKIKEEIREYLKLLEYTNNMTWKGVGRAVYLNGLPEMPLENITIKNMVVTDARQGIVLNKVAKVNIENVKIETPDHFPIHVENATGITIDGKEFGTIAEKRLLTKK